MNHDQLLDAVLERSLLAILRGDDGQHFVELAKVLYESGVSIIEIALTTPSGLGIIRELRRTMPADAIIGAGTVLNRLTAVAALEAGAQFLVSPAFDAAVVKTAKQAGALAIPGAMTPTEILAAWEADADIVKVFPAEALGPDYLRAVLRPLPQIRLIATGNITIEAAPQFLDAGSCGLGIGGPLCNAPGLNEVRALARQYVEIVHAHRSKRAACH